MNDKKFYSPKRKQKKKMKRENEITKPYDLQKKVANGKEKIYKTHFNHPVEEKKVFEL